MEHTGYRDIRAWEEGDLGNISLQKKETQEDGVLFLTYSFHAEEPVDFPGFAIHIMTPAREIHYRWTPKLHLIKALNSDWFENLNRTSGFTGAPVECLMGLDDKNRGTYGLSDTLHNIGFKTVPYEETAEYDTEILLFDQEGFTGTDYELTIRIDRRPIPYYEALRENTLWWESLPGNEPAAVPVQARELMYSTWYSYHQQVDSETLLKQAKLAKALGCKNLLLDDGWQTEDNNRGYAYCGDWKPAPSKFPDMAEFVRQMHQLGMGVIPWYSVPFIGEKSENYSRFADMVIDPAADRQWHVLDPRYPQVREFLIGIYEKALADWDLDGFKLDFIDEFIVTPFSGSRVDHRRDYTSFTEAADRLMKDLTNRLRGHKKDIMLEFRQTYNGPRMRSFGNIFRAVDCPFDDMENHVRVTDIRLLAGESAVHSDMLMWDKEDSVESAAIQLSRILFSVPQISMRLEELPPEHGRMLSYYCRLWQRYKEVFVGGTFVPISPSRRYPVIMARAGDCLACVYHGPEVISPEGGAGRMVFVNGSGTEGIWLSLNGDGAFYKRTICCCTGDILVCDGLRDQGGVLSMEIPRGGTLELIKCNRLY